MSQKVVIDVPGTAASALGSILLAPLWMLYISVYPLVLAGRFVLGLMRHRKRERLRSERQRVWRGRRESWRRAASTVMPWLRDPIRDQVIDHLSEGDTLREVRGFRRFRIRRRITVQRLGGNGVTMKVGPHGPYTVPWGLLDALVRALDDEHMLPVNGPLAGNGPTVETLLNNEGVYGLAMALPAILEKAGIVDVRQGVPSLVLSVD